MNVRLHLALLLLAALPAAAQNGRAVRGPAAVVPSVGGAAAGVSAAPETRRIESLIGDLRSAGLAIVPSAPTQTALAAFTRGALDRAGRAATPQEHAAVGAELRLLHGASAVLPEREREAVRQAHAALWLGQAQDAEATAGRKVAEAGRAWNADGDLTLGQVFHGEPILHVLNADAGNGSWQRDIRGQKWLAKDAVVLGTELDRPLPYPGEEKNPRKDWDGLVMVTHPKSPLLPKPGSLDLVHLGFMDMWDGSWKERLAGYRRLVRPGGFFMLAHSATYDLFLHAKGKSAADDTAEGLLSEGFLNGAWRLAARFGEAAVPADYPTTYWWKEFQREAAAAKANGERNVENFLLVFQKK